MDKKIEVEVLFWAVLLDVRLHCFEDSQASPSCTSGNSKMKIAWGISGMIMTAKSLHQCHFVHLIAHVNWLGIRTWAPAVRHATNSLNQGMVPGQTVATSAVRYPFILQREKNTPSGFSAQNGFHRVLPAALHWVFPVS
jgi:hypothetical protein